jgi:enoyl-CoA hydratase/carnithine racemase
MGCRQMTLTRSFASGGISAQAADFVGSLKISNPARKNALTLEMWREMPTAIAWLVESCNARVILLSGDGSADFSAGADISEFDTVRKDTASALTYEASNSQAFSAIRQAAVPVIAVIRGICYGGGFGLAAACDIRIADTSARFAVPAAKLGLAYPADAIADFIHALGIQKAGLAVYTGRQFTADDLLNAGFLADIAEPAALELSATGLASEIAANAPLSIRATKTALLAAATGRTDLFEKALIQGAATFDSLDYAEGRAAFATRRKPQFTGQ